MHHGSSSSFVKSARQDLPQGRQPVRVAIRTVRTRRRRAARRDALASPPAAPPLPAGGRDLAQASLQERRWHARPWSGCIPRSVVSHGASQPHSTLPLSALPPSGAPEALRAAALCPGQWERWMAASESEPALPSATRSGSSESALTWMPPPASEGTSPSREFGEAYRSKLLQAVELCNVCGWFFTCE